MEMKKQSESQLQTKVMKYLRDTYKEEFFVWKVSERFSSGIPDIMGIYKGVPFYIELKVGSNKPTKLQEITMHELANAGAVGGVAYSLEQVKVIMLRVIQVSVSV